MIINHNASLGLNFFGMQGVQSILLVVLGVLWWRDKRAWGYLLMIIGGALNLLERWFFGGVRDYWRIPFTSIYNNINDYLIVAGVIQLVYHILWKKRQK